VSKNHNFKAVVLDLFDTLVRWEPERLPLMELGGKQVRTTMPWVFPKMAELFGSAFERERFVEIYSAVIEEITLEREREGIEITCHERFHRTLKRLALEPIDQAAAFAEKLTRVHMDAVRSVTWAPAERIAAVRMIAPHYRLGLLSNFDDAQCGREVLHDTGVADLFEAVVISAEVRLRKPDRRIFEHLRAMLSLDPHEILFVGDTPRDDVLGAREAGMRSVWISKGQPSLPEGIPAPDFIIRDLSDLPRLLGILH
jgi:HAD superfamily hydrolase (TIGR01549 family)